MFYFISYYSKQIFLSNKLLGLFSFYILYDLLWTLSNYFFLHLIFIYLYHHFFFFIFHKLSKLKLFLEQLRLLNLLLLCILIFLFLLYYIKSFSFALSKVFFILLYIMYFK